MKNLTAASALVLALLSGCGDKSDKNDKSPEVPKSEKKNESPKPEGEKPKGEDNQTSNNNKTPKVTTESNGAVSERIYGSWKFKQTYDFEFSKLTAFVKLEPKKATAVIECSFKDSGTTMYSEASSPALISDKEIEFLEETQHVEFLNDKKCSATLHKAKFQYEFVNDEVRFSRAGYPDQMLERVPEEATH